jgi:excisionase family DNA binding protein
VNDTLTAQEAATLRGVSIEAVRRAIRANRLPATRTGKGYALQRADVEAWLIVGHRPKGGGKKKRVMAWHGER